MADYLSPTPYANPLTGLSNDMIQGLLGYMKDKQRTQQMQGLAGLLESTGIPQTVERAAYAQSPKALLDTLTNVNRANMPLLKAETADALMNIAPMVGPALRGAEAATRGAGRLAGEAVNDAMVYGRGPLASITPQPMRMIGEDAVNLPQKGSKLVHIPIDMIEHGESAMPGGKLTWATSRERIKDYASRETPLPPIDVVSNETGAPWMVADGSHRLEAAKLRGDKTISAFVSPYDKEGMQMVEAGQSIEGLLGQSKAASKIDEPMRTFKTSDGFTLYETKDGKIVDSLDPDAVDMSWDSYAQLKDDFGDDVYQVGDDLSKRKSATSSTGNPKLLDDWYSYRTEPTKDELFQQALNKQNEPKKASIVPIGAAETNARKAIEDLMNQARYFGVDSPIDYTKMPVGAVMQDLDSYLGMSKQVADLPDAAKTSLRNLWYKAEDAAKAYKRVYGENKLMGKPEEAANDARKNPMLWDEKKLKKLLKDGTFTQDEYDNALAWNKKNKGLLD